MAYTAAEAFAIAEQRIEEERKDRTGKLDLGGLGLSHLPDSLWKLTHLKELKLAANELTEISSSLGNLINIRTIDICYNELQFLPSSIGKCRALTELRLSYNLLAEIPNEIGSLKDLFVLDLESNALRFVPDSIGSLKGLGILYLSSNYLARLPLALKELTNLLSLYLHGNDLLAIPPEVLGPPFAEEVRKGLQCARPADILAYYFRTSGASGESRSLNEAKLIIVGRGGVGKTSLVRRLLGRGFDPAEDKTQGIQISPWDLSITEAAVRLHIWDFGGQEIMHATHQFFLTARSLYLLVLNGREGGEDQDARYWLKLIDSFGGDSPIIVVLNKNDQHPFDLNRRDLQSKFPQICGFIKTECKDGTGIDALHAAIINAVSTLNGVRAKFPSSWFAIKDTLAQMPQKLGASFVGYDRYRAICRDHGEVDESAQDDLATILHCLGIALNFKDDPRLQDTSVLNPHWVTAGIYQLLNSPVLAQSGGELRLADLKNLLNPKEYPPEKHEFLLELMCKFKLCFAYPEDPQRRYLIPELLDKQEPVLGREFEPAACLNFEYRYGILPEGLLPGFIVRTHLLSRGQPRWRTGVVLQREGCYALAKADVASFAVPRVVIRVHGGTPEKRQQLLAIIRWDFERMHQAIAKLEVEAQVPLPDHPGVAIPYHDLDVRDRAGKKTCELVVGDQLVTVDVKHLLSGVDLDRSAIRSSERAKLDRAARVFISYSHKDDLLREELETHLKLLERQGKISTWSDRKLMAGDSGGEKIDAQLESADIILLLVSVDFLASKYCYDVEMTRALARHAAAQARVIPILVRECDWTDAPFSKLQALPKDGVPVSRWPTKDAGWNEVAKGIRQAADELTRRAM